MEECGKLQLKQELEKITKGPNPRERRRRRVRSFHFPGQKEREGGGDETGTTQVDETVCLV